MPIFLSRSARQHLVCAFACAGVISCVVEVAGVVVGWLVGSLGVYSLLRREWLP